MFQFPQACSVITLLVLALAQPVLSDDAVTEKPNVVSGNSSNRWLLLCCGLAGDDLHQERLTEACKKIVEHCGPVLGIPPQQLRVLAGNESMRVAVAETNSEVGLCTKESIQEGMQWLAKNAAQQDEAWMILLGHAHLYGNRSQFNIQDRDIDQIEFAELAKGLTQHRQVILLTMPVSGFWAKPLARQNRVVITATEPGLEFTGTEMPYVVADVLAGQSEHQNLQDIDGDGIVSLLDFYLAVNLEIEATFRSMDRLQTEHAQLDDNGDGNGSEVQAAYLPVISKDDESVTKPALPAPIAAETLDGFLSRHIPLQSN